MNRIGKKALGFLLLGQLAVLSGCATILAGSTQDVEVLMPKGTLVQNSDESIVPLRYDHRYGDSIAFIRLERDRNYYLRFTNGDHSVVATLNGEAETAWIILDALTLWGLIVDGITEDWNSFDGIAIRFPPPGSRAEAMIEPFDAAEQHRVGGMMYLGTGLVFPFRRGEIDFAFFNTYQIGAGFRVLKDLRVGGFYEAGAGINILPRNSEFLSSGYFGGVHLQTQYSFIGSLYVGAGIGYTRVSSDSLRYDYYARNGGNSSSPAFPGTSKWMPTASIALGLFGSTTHLELRHQIGLLSIPLSTGEIGTFETTSLHFGFHFSF